MSGTGDVLHVIELTSARLRQDIGATETQTDTPADCAAEVPWPARLGGLANKAPADATWRLKLLHAAWDRNSEPLPFGHVRSLVTGLPADVVVDPAALEANCVFPPPIGRIVLNLLLLAAESLPMGGTVRLAGSASDLFLQITGAGAAWPPGMAACVVDETAAVTAINDTAGNGSGRLQMGFATLLAHAAGVRLSFLLGGSGLRAPPVLRLGGG